MNGQRGGGQYGGMMGDGPTMFGGMHAAYPNDYSDNMGRLGGVI